MRKETAAGKPAARIAGGTISAPMFFRAKKWGNRERAEKARRWRKEDREVMGFPDVGGWVMMNDSPCAWGQGRSMYFP
jgi:hypothetical protein